MLCTDLIQFKNNLVPGLLLAVDLGSKKLGLARSDSQRILAMPLHTIILTPKDQIIEHITKAIDEYKAVGLIFGLPVDMRGRETEATAKIREFTTKIANLISIPIFLQDERFSSREADNILIAMGLNRKQRNSMDDQVAASLILETVLDSLKRL